MFMGSFNGADAATTAPKAEDINFLLTNRIPRRYATIFMGWFSRIEVSWVKRLSLAAFRFFADDLELDEARDADFRSLHDCFIRELKEGARPIDRDPGVVVSPCDAIVGAFGQIRGRQLVQAKGFPYTLTDLLGDEALVKRHEDGMFVTLRLKSNMYHRFHAPCAGRVSEVIYVSGDTWNVNPIALRRVERLFCKNERAVIDVETPGEGQAITLVPVAAILVAGIKLHFLENVLDLRYRGKNRIGCDATFEKGDELGYFQSGSTIILFATGGFSFCEGVVEGARIRVGEPLLRGLRPAVHDGAASGPKPRPPAEPKQDPRDQQDTIRNGDVHER
jgi:phosphatidylserine decarboxylase